MLSTRGGDASRSEFVFEIDRSTFHQGVSGKQEEAFIILLLHEERREKISTRDGLHYTKSHDLNNDGSEEEKSTSDFIRIVVGVRRIK